MTRSAYVQVRCAVVRCGASAINATPPRPVLKRQTNEISQVSLGGFGQQRPAGQHASIRLLGEAYDRSCARRFAGDWTANGMSCPPLA